MSAQLTYPGVYIEEIPSGVRTITGVATSIAAFVGWASQGPTDQAVRVLGWGDYERLFGSLHLDSPMSYAVSHFFANGGQEAYILRVAAADAAFGSAAVGDLTLTATGPGKWAANYGVEVTIPDPDDPAHFRLVVKRKGARGQPQTEEVFERLSLDRADPRFAKSVLDEQSQFVNADVAENATTIAAADLTMLEGGEDGAILRPGTADFHAAVPVEDDEDEDTPPAGLALLKRVDLFNLLCIPGETDPAFLQKMADFCEEQRAFLIVDCRSETTFRQMLSQLGDLPTGEALRNAAFYFPYIKAPDPLQQGRLRAFPPCGAVAGIYARTDANRGVWKAPAGVDASLVGVRGPSEPLTDEQNGLLNPKAVNCLRAFPVYGTVVWGARTLRGQDEVGSEWKYVPVRRTALFIEETLYRSLKWVVFEPNDEPLWAQIRLNVGAFMQGLFRQGAFQGRTPREAYFVKCDRETTTQNDINLGVVNILVGFAPLKPAEFVVVKLQQMAGQIEV